MCNALFPEREITGCILCCNELKTSKLTSIYVPGPTRPLKRDKLSEKGNIRN